MTATAPRRSWVTTTPDGWRADADGWTVSLDRGVRGMVAELRSPDSLIVLASASKLDQPIGPSMAESLWAYMLSQMLEPPTSSVLRNAWLEICRRHSADVQERS